MTDEERKAKRAAYMRDWERKNPDKVKASREKRAERMREYNQQYYAANREKRLVQMAEYRAANPEVCAAASKAWHVANKDRRVGYEKTQRAKHYPEIKARQDAWRRANPDKVAEQSAAAIHKRRARKLKVGGVLSRADVRALKESADGICAYCLQPAAKLHVEHCTPLCRGGTNTLDNCVMACASCNSRKGQKTVLEFLFNYPKLGAPA